MPRIESRPLPEKVDVAILGAGFTGLSAARTLAKLGARVRRPRSRNGSDGARVPATAAWFFTGLKLGAADLISRYGKETTRRMFSASLEAISTVRANRRGPKSLIATFAVADTLKSRTSQVISMHSSAVPRRWSAS